MSPQPLNSSQSGASQKLKFVPAGVLIERRREIDDLIARRAYEIFERRGAVHGHDLDDWLWAESEVLYPCRHELEDLPEALVLKAEMPGDFTADELELSIEPRRLMVSGNRIVDAIYGDQRGGHFERIPERIFHVHELPVEIDPSRTTAALQAGTLEVIMPKARRRIEP
jgi:HSP20 family molecular chaperone IbpA